jgi:lipopolysaccharide biosynthesis glycosyltransferase
MALRIFIGFDRREAECADVLAYSLREHASIPLEIRYLKLSELDFDRPLDPLQSTEFTYSRFLVPRLCGYRGKAIFMDCDMLCLGDIKELDDLDMADYALRVVKHDHRPSASTKMDGRVQTTYPRKNWSSLMVMNCARLTLWTKEVVETESGAFLHRFQGIDDASTRLVHYTSGGPWFEACKDHPYGAAWLEWRDRFRASQLQRQVAGGQAPGGQAPGGQAPGGT